MMCNQFGGHIIYFNFLAHFRSIIRFYRNMIKYEKRVILALLVILSLFFGMSSTVFGAVTTRVCLADGNTPLELVDPNNHIYLDIMVGTKLTILVDSNVGESWNGRLAIEGSDVNYGQLFGRDYNDVTWEYEGSHLEAAGPDAFVWWYFDMDANGFTMDTDSEDEDVEPGEWFIIDYNAVEIGDCNIVFYDGFFEDHQLSFTHVATRDFNGDTVVDFEDYGILASYWRASDCNDPNWCEGADIDVDGYVDPNDLRLFVDYWLEKTE